MGEANKIGTQAKPTSFSQEERAQLPPPANASHQSFENHNLLGEGSYFSSSANTLENPITPSSNPLLTRQLSNYQAQLREASQDLWTGDYGQGRRAIEELEDQLAELDGQGLVNPEDFAQLEAMQESLDHANERIDRTAEWAHGNYLGLLVALYQKTQSYGARSKYAQQSESLLELLGDFAATKTPEGIPLAQASEPLQTLFLQVQLDLARAYYQQDLSTTGGQAETQVHGDDIVAAVMEDKNLSPAEQAPFLALRMLSRLARQDITLAEFEQALEDFVQLQESTAENAPLWEKLQTIFGTDQALATLELETAKKILWAYAQDSSLDTYRGDRNLENPKTLTTTALAVTAGAVWMPIGEVWQSWADLLFIKTQAPENSTLPSQAALNLQAQLALLAEACGISLPWNSRFFLDSELKDLENAQGKLTDPAAWQETIAYYKNQIRQVYRQGQAAVQLAQENSLSSDPETQAQEQILAFKETTFDTWKHYRGGKAQLIDFFAPPYLQGIDFEQKGLAPMQGGNCVSQTLFFINALKSSGLKLPDHWEIAVQVFDNHVQPVIYDHQNRQVWELVSGEWRASKKFYGTVVKAEFLYWARLNQQGIDSLVPPESLILAEKNADFPPELPRKAGKANNSGLNFGRFAQGSYPGSVPDYALLNPQGHPVQEFDFANNTFNYVRTEKGGEAIPAKAIQPFSIDASNLLDNPRKDLVAVYQASSSSEENPPRFRLLGNQLIFSKKEDYQAYQRAPQEVKLDILFDFLMDDFKAVLNPKDLDNLIKTLEDPRHYGSLSPQEKKALNYLANTCEHYSNLDNNTFQEGSPLAAEFYKALKALLPDPQVRSKRMQHFYPRIFKESPEFQKLHRAYQDFYLSFERDPLSYLLKLNSLKPREVESLGWLIFEDMDNCFTNRQRPKTSEDLTITDLLATVLIDPNLVGFSEEAITQEVSRPQKTEEVLAYVYLKDFSKKKTSPFVEKTKTKPAPKPNAITLHSQNLAALLEGLHISYRLNTFLELENDSLEQAYYEYLKETRGEEKALEKLSRLWKYSVPEKSIAAAKKLTELNTSAKNLYFYAESLRIGGKPKQALLVAQKAFAQDKEIAPYIDFLKGHTEYSDVLKRELRKNLKKDPKNARLWSALGSYYLQKQYPQAIQAYQKALKHSEEPEQKRDILKKLAQFAAYEDMEQAKLYYTALIQNLSQTGDENELALVYRTLGGDLEAAGLNEEAIQAFRSEQAYGYNRPEYTLIPLLIETGQLAEAEALLKERRTIIGDHEGILISQAKLLEAKGELALAEDLFRQVYNKNSGAFDYLIDLTQVLTKQGKKAEALRLYQDFLTSYGDDFEDKEILDEIKAKIKELQS